MMAVTSPVRTHVWEIVLAGTWRSIGDTTLQDALEASFSAASDGYQFNARGYTYEIDFGRMVQLNKSTKRERKLRRVLNPSASPAAPISAVAAPGAAVVTTPAVAAPGAAVVTTPAVAAPGVAVVTTPAAVVPAVTPAAKATRKVRAVRSSAPVPMAKAVSGPVSHAPPASVPVPPPVPSAPPRPRGTVKSFFKEKGYGFITMKSGEDVFFHKDAIVSDSVRPNDIVELKLAKDRAGRTRATEVHVMKKGSIYRTICRNKCCQAKGDRHFEDRCPRGGLHGDDSSVSTAAS